MLFDLNILFLQDRLQARNQLVSLLTELLEHELRMLMNLGSSDMKFVKQALVTFINFISHDQEFEVNGCSFRSSNSFISDSLLNGGQLLQMTGA